MDGVEKIHMSFEPSFSRTYCVVATGAEMGLRGEPKNPGLIVHELGDWTSAEEFPVLPRRAVASASRLNGQPATSGEAAGSGPSKQARNLSILIVGCFLGAMVWEQLRVRCLGAPLRGEGCSVLAFHASAARISVARLRGLLSSDRAT